METGDLDDLYGDPILDHRRHPRNSDVVEDPDVAGRAVNPFCGDEVDVQISLDAGRAARIGVQSEGCSINQATASMMSERISGKSIEEIEVLSNLFHRLMDGEQLSDEELGTLGELQSLVGVRRYPVRIKCALLSWSGLEEAIEKHRVAQHA